MVKFVELANENLLNASSIEEIRPYVRTKSNSEKIKVVASVQIIGSGGNLWELISGAGEAPWPNEDAERYERSCVERYERLGVERAKLEKFIRSFFADIVHKMCLDMKIYYPAPSIREQLQQAAQDAAERIVKGVEKNE